MPTYTQQKENMKNVIGQFLSTPKGKKYIDDFMAGRTKQIVIDLGDISDFQLATAQELIENASLYGLSALEDAVDLYISINYGMGKISRNQISLTGNFPLSLIHELGANEVGQIVRVHGLVNKIAPIRPMYTQAIFKCSNCGKESQPIIQDNPWKLVMPFPKCSSCGERVSWDPIPQLSDLIDSQEFSIQESYEDILSSKIPRPIRCMTFKNHLMNYINCGDDVEVVCVVSAMSASQKFSKSKFNTTYLEVLDIFKRKKDPESIVFTMEEESKFKELAQDSEVYTKMINSLAPSLYGHENEKEAVLLAIFGSPEEKREDITIRGNIHILMVGDPATAKSQLLRAAVELSPRGMYTMGRGTTAAGLTAALHKDNDTGEWEISAGVLVLADEGIAAIDEIDKMREEDRINIHEAMEQQTVSIDKAGYHVQMKARTAVIAAANPTLGRYDQYKSVFENLPKFPPSLFSRFDLIFKILDVPNEVEDTNIVAHIIDCQNIKSPIDRAFLRKYVAYSKRIKPILSVEAADALKTYYVAVRKNYSSDQKTFPFSPRQFEALKRLTLARARSLLKNEANIKDVECVKRLFNVFLQDTLSGDVTTQECGMDNQKRNFESVHMQILQILQTPMSKSDARNRVKCESDKQFNNIWNWMLGKGVIYEPDGDGIFHVTQHTLS
jgi:replicative DNA helicase Mcm